MKQSVIEGLLRNFPNSLTKVAEHAYKRYKYFHAILKATTEEQSKPMFLAPPGADEFSPNEEITAIEENFIDLTEQEEDEMLTMLGHTFGNLETKEEKRRENAEIKKKYQTLKKQIDDLKATLVNTEESHARTASRLKSLISSTPSGTPFSQIFSQLAVINLEEGGLTSS